MADFTVNWRIDKVDRNLMNGDHVIVASLTLSTEVIPFATITATFSAGTTIPEVWNKLKLAADPYVYSYLEHGQYVTNLLNQSGSLVYTV